MRRAVLGPTDEERVETLSQKAENNPASITADEIDELADLLDHENPEIVSSALAALGMIVSDQPGRVAKLAPRVVKLPSTRPREEWATTTVGEMDDEFMIDMGAGMLLLELARDDPSHLRPVVPELAATIIADDGALEPHTWFALAHVTAADAAEIDVNEMTFVEGTCATLRSQVDNESGRPIVKVCPASEAVELLRAFGDPAAIDTLRYVRDETNDAELATDSTS